MECNFIDIEIRVWTESRARLARALPLSGAAFSAACRHVGCSRPDRGCGTCADRFGCAWLRVFGQELACDPVALKRHQKPPLPFVFSFPLAELPPDAAGVLTCGLKVIGSAMPCLGMLLSGFERLLTGDACPVQGRIDAILTLDFQSMPAPLTCSGFSENPSNLVVLSGSTILKQLPAKCERCTLQLLSPLRLSRDGRVVKRFDFSLFARTVMRRISSLIYYYENHEVSRDFRGLSLQADAICCSRDDFIFDDGSSSRRQMTGIVGMGCFQGDFSGLMPFLVLGGFFHAGKNCSFGCGEFAVFFE